ncbi:MAG: methionyl-tRNA formyltransferase [Cycloclasticus sp.]|jgi:methionyl-tRNA formyltransferase
MNIIFAGTPAFSISSLQALIASEHRVCAVYTQPDRPAGRGRKVQIGAVKQLALDNGIPIEQPVSFKSSQVLERLKHYQADLMVVVAYGIILPIDVLTTPRYGCINIHASLLPRWRGAAPIQRAILTGDNETGVTLMQMDAGLDTGDMLSKSICPIEQDDTSSTLHDKLSLLGAETLIKLLADIERQQLTPKAQPTSGVTYAHKLSKQEALIDWHMPAVEVHRAIRGYNPWPVAHTLLNNNSLRIWQSKTTADRTNDEPGSIKVDKNQLFVACKDNYLEITELQPANKRRMSAREYLSAHPLNNVVFG